MELLAMYLMFVVFIFLVIFIGIIVKKKKYQEDQRSSNMNEEEIKEKKQEQSNKKTNKTSIEHELGQEQEDYKQGSAHNSQIYRENKLEQYRGSVNTSNSSGELKFQQRQEKDQFSVDYVDDENTKRHNLQRNNQSDHYTSQSKQNQNGSIQQKGKKQKNNGSQPKLTKEIIIQLTTKNFGNEMDEILLDWIDCVTFRVLTQNKSIINDYNSPFFMKEKQTITFDQWIKDQWQFKPKPTDYSFLDTQRPQPLKNIENPLNHSGSFNIYSSEIVLQNLNIQGNNEKQIVSENEIQVQKQKNIQQNIQQSIKSTYAFIDDDLLQLCTQCLFQMNLLDIQHHPDIQVNIVLLLYYQLQDFQGNNYYNSMTKDIVEYQIKYSPIYAQLRSILQKKSQQNPIQMQIVDGGTQSINTDLIQQSYPQQIQIEQTNNKELTLGAIYESLEKQGFNRDFKSVIDDFEYITLKFLQIVLKGQDEKGYYYNQINEQILKKLGYDALQGDMQILFKLNGVSMQILLENKEKNMKIQDDLLNDYIKQQKKWVPKENSNSGIIIQKQKELLLNSIRKKFILEDEKLMEECFDAVFNQIIKIAFLQEKYDIIENIILILYLQIKQYINQKNRTSIDVFTILNLFFNSPIYRELANEKNYIIQQQIQIPVQNDKYKQNQKDDSNVQWKIEPNIQQQIQIPVQNDKYKQNQKDDSNTKKKIEPDIQQKTQNEKYKQNQKDAPIAQKKIETNIQQQIQIVQNDKQKQNQKDAPIAQKKIETNMQSILNQLKQIGFQDTDLIEKHFQHIYIGFLRQFFINSDPEYQSLLQRIEKELALNGIDHKPNNTYILLNKNNIQQIQEGKITDDFIKKNVIKTPIRDVIQINSNAKVDIKKKQGEMENKYDIRQNGFFGKCLQYVYNLQIATENKLKDEIFELMAITLYTQLYQMAILIQQTNKINVFDAFVKDPYNVVDQIYRSPIYKEIINPLNYNSSIEKQEKIIQNNKTNEVQQQKSASIISNEGNKNQSNEKQKNSSKISDNQIQQPQNQSVQLGLNPLQNQINNIYPQNTSLQNQNDSLKQSQPMQEFKQNDDFELDLSFIQDMEGNKSILQQSKGKQINNKKQTLNMDTICALIKENGLLWEKDVRQYMKDYSKYMVLDIVEAILDEGEYNELVQLLGQTIKPINQYLFNLEQKNIQNITNIQQNKEQNKEQNKVQGIFWLFGLDNIQNNYSLETSVQESQLKGKYQQDIYEFLTNRFHIQDIELFLHCISNVLKIKNFQEMNEKNKTKIYIMVLLLYLQLRQNILFNGKHIGLYRQFIINKEQSGQSIILEQLKRSPLFINIYQLNEDFVKKLSFLQQNNQQQLQIQNQLQQQKQTQQDTQQKVLQSLTQKHNDEENNKQQEESKIQKESKIQEQPKKQQQNQVQQRMNIDINAVQQLIQNEDLIIKDLQERYRYIYNGVFKYSLFDGDDASYEDWILNNNIQIDSTIYIPNNWNGDIATLSLDKYQNFIYHHTLLKDSMKVYNVENDETFKQIKLQYSIADIELLKYCTSQVYFRNYRMQDNSLKKILILLLYIQLSLAIEKKEQQQKNKYFNDIYTKENIVYGLGIKQILNSKLSDEIIQKWFEKNTSKK